MRQIIQQILDVFKENREDVHQQWEMIDQLVAEGRTDVLYELGSVLEKAYQEESLAPAEVHDERSLTPMLAIASIYEHLEDALAHTSGIHYAQTIINLFLFRGSHSWPLAAHSLRLAPFLVESQSTDILLDLIKEYEQYPKCTEFLAVLVQEMILHGIPCDQFPIIDHFVEQLKAISHPLVRLPLTLLPIENLFPNLFSFEGWNEREEERIAFIQQAAPFPFVQEEQMLIEEDATAYEQDRIRTAIIPWTCSQSEVGIFALNRAATGVSENALLSLPLLSLKGMHSPHDSLRALSPHDACSYVFASASRGGPYDAGYGRAYGRLAAWRTLAGLTGAETSASIEEIASVVEQCRWFNFTNDNDWFDVGPWQLGLIAIRPDGRSFAVIAATAID